MLVRSILASYSKPVVGILLAFSAIALAGCNDSVAQKAEPMRPVLVATAHYEAESPERSFVGTIRRELLDRILIINQGHAATVLREFERQQDGLRGEVPLVRAFSAQPSSEPSGHL